MAQTANNNLVNNLKPIKDRVMSQGLFSAMFKGPTAPEGARKVIKFVAYYGFITVALGLGIFIYTV